MAKKRAVKKTGKKTKARSRHPLASSGNRKATTKAVGAKKAPARKGVVKKKAARRSAVTVTSRGAEQARKTLTAKRRSAIAQKAAGSLPKKITAQKRRAAQASPRPPSDVGVREVQSPAPAVPVVVGEAPGKNKPLRSGNDTAPPEAAENDIE